MAHTPGPWDIVFNDDVARIRLNGSTVYQVADSTDPDFPTGKPRYNWADLRLMAAAPELLVALRLARDDLSDLLEVADLTDEGVADTTEVLNKVIAAIAKAAGRE